MTWMAWLDFDLGPLRLSSWVHRIVLPFAVYWHELINGAIQSSTLVPIVSCKTLPTNQEVFHIALLLLKYVFPGHGLILYVFVAIFFFFFYFVCSVHAYLPAATIYRIHWIAACWENTRQWLALQPDPTLKYNVNHPILISFTAILWSKTACNFIVDHFFLLILKYA